MHLAILLSNLTVRPDLVHAVCGTANTLSLHCDCILVAAICDVWQAVTFAATCMQELSILQEQPATPTHLLRRQQRILDVGVNEQVRAALVSCSKASNVSMHVLQAPMSVLQSHAGTVPSMLVGTAGNSTSMRLTPSSIAASTDFEASSTSSE
jgi:hypothetical protein